MKGIFLRKRGTGNGERGTANDCFDRAQQCDPLEYWAVVEKDGFEVASKNRGLKAQQLLECISDYWGIGCYNEVIALCDAALAKAAVEKPYKTEGALPLAETLRVTPLDGDARPLSDPFVAEASDGFASFDISEKYRTVWYLVEKISGGEKCQTWTPQ